MNSSEWWKIEELKNRICVQHEIELYVTTRKGKIINQHSGVRKTEMPYSAFEYVIKGLDDKVKTMCAFNVQHKSYKMSSGGSAEPYLHEVKTVDEAGMGYRFVCISYWKTKEK